MRNLNIAIRSLFKKGRHNVMKIISLSVGLSVALVMIAKIYFEQSYDTFYPDADRIYRIYENYSMNGKEEDYYQVSGAVAPAMRSEIPGVEDATRLTYIGGDNTLFTTPDKQRYSARYIMIAVNKRAKARIPNIITMFFTSPALLCKSSKGLSV